MIIKNSLIYKKLLLFHTKKFFNLKIIYLNILIGHLSNYIED